MIHMLFTERIYKIKKSTYNKRNRCGGREITKSFCGIRAIRIQPSRQKLDTRRLRDAQAKEIGPRHVLSLNDFKVIDVRAGIIREDPDSAGRHRSR